MNEHVETIETLVIEDTLFPVMEHNIPKPTIAYDKDGNEVYPFDGDESGYKLLIRGDTDQIISCMSTQYKLITNQEILDKALPIIEENGGEIDEVTAFGDARFTYKFTFPDEKIEIQTGDFVNPQLILRNSYDGTSEVSAIGGAYRLVCSNGMIVGYILDKSSGGRHIVWNDDTNVEDIVRDTIFKLKQIFTKDFPLLVNRKITDKDIEAVIKLFPSQVIGDLCDYLIAESPKTYWDLLNASTWVATHIMNRKNEATHRLEEKIYPLIVKLSKTKRVDKDNENE